MHCPFCQTEDTKVVDSRLGDEGSQVRRRRECGKCSQRFTTVETAAMVMPKVIKRDGTRESFNADKLHASLQKALEKRPVSTEDVETAIGRILRKIQASGERELPSASIGEMAMEVLRKLDQVAYVRFASVYRSFEDVREFSEEVERLAKR